MTTKEKLHRLVDELSPKKVEELFQYATRTTRVSESSSPAKYPVPIADLFDADPDFSARSEEILKELAHRS